MRKFEKSTKLDNVCYEIRGPVMDKAKAMEQNGYKILKLNIGNPAPFDLNAPVIEIKDEDFALWYRDVTEEPEKYDGKTVCFKAQVAMLRRDKNGMFAPGRFIMTCCADDIQFCGLPCKWPGSKELKSRSWVMVEATISAEKHRLYQGEMGPVLTAISVTPAAPAVEEVCTF